MIRKISTKAQPPEQKTKKQNVYVTDSEYYLMHPNCKIFKTQTKDREHQSIKDRLYAKYHKKYSHTGSARTLSLAHTNYEPNSHSKQLEHNQYPHQKALNSRPKVQGLKNRAASLFETPKKYESKNGLKINLGSRKQIAIKRLNLKIETPNSKKQKWSIKDQQNNNDDHYYRKSQRCQLQPQSKTMRTKMKPEGAHQSMNKSEYQICQNYQLMLYKCKDLLSQYQSRLELARVENSYLLQENRRLRAERSQRNVSR